MKRCIKPRGFGKIVHISLHSFSDASNLGYGESSHLRLVDEYRHIHCTMMMAKARVTPRRFVSIPWLDLAAAALPVKISPLIKKELENWQNVFGQIPKLFWSLLQTIPELSKHFSKHGASNTRIQQCKPIELHSIRGQSSWRCF